MSFVTLVFSAGITLPRVSRASAISESVLRDFNGLRRHFRVGGDGGRRETLSIIRSAAPNRKERISSGETKRFAKGILSR